LSGYKDPWIEIMEGLKRIEGKIDALAEKGGAGGRGRIPATKKQIDLILKLSEEMGLGLTEFDVKGMSIGQASRKISELLGKQV